MRKKIALQDAYQSLSNLSVQNPFFVSLIHCKGIKLTCGTPRVHAYALTCSNDITYSKAPAALYGNMSASHINSNHGTRSALLHSDFIGDAPGRNTPLHHQSTTRPEDEPQSKITSCSMRPLGPRKQEDPTHSDPTKALKVVHKPVYLHTITSMCDDATAAIPGDTRTRGPKIYSSWSGQGKRL